MEKLFSVPMGVIAIGMSTVLIIMLVVLGTLAYRNTILLKIGLRNIPRRLPQTILVVLGLTLSTTLITASLALGDTISTSIRQSALQGLGNVDLTIKRPYSAAFSDDFISSEQLTSVLETIQADKRVDGAMPGIRERLPLAARLGTVNARTVARATIFGLDIDAQQGFGELRMPGGGSVMLASMGPSDVYVNVNVAEKLAVSTGDHVTLFTPKGQTELVVKAVVEDTGLAGARPGMFGSSGSDVALIPVSTLQRLLGRSDQVNRVELSIVGERRPTREMSDEITGDLRVFFTDPDVADSLFDILRSPESRAAIGGYLDRNNNMRGEVEKDLRQLLRELDEPEPRDEFRSLMGGEMLAGTVVVALEEANLGNVAFETIRQVGDLVVLSVDETKIDVLDIADQIGQGFTTIFTVFGSFSIMVGVLLIFLVFVMLAASRTTELGIARAIGTRRRQLVMTFVFEGVAYAVLASLAGVVLGILASMGLVSLLSQLIPQDVDFTVIYSVQFRSLLVAFAAGIIITVTTVTVSAYRVSRLNIAVAIRGLSEQFVPRVTIPLSQRLSVLLHSLLGPIYLLVRAWRLSRSGAPWKVSTVVGVGLLIPFVGTGVWLVWILASTWRLISSYFDQGWPIILIALLMVVAGVSKDSAALFSVGTSVLFIGFGLLTKLLLLKAKRREETVSRISFSLIGALLLVFWALPSGALDSVTGELEGDIEMFFLSGSFMVAAAVWLVIHNPEILTWPLSTTLGRVRGLRPVIRAALAYPMAAKFRTGLTLAMFSLVVFTLMVFAVINQAFSNTILDDFDRVTGGYEIRATISRDLPIRDIEELIEKAPELDIDDFEVIASSAGFRGDVRQVGPYNGEPIEEKRFLPLSIAALDEKFMRTNLFDLAHFDPAFGSTSRDIWDSLARDPSLAVVSFPVIQDEFQPFSDQFASMFKAQGVDPGGDERITAMEVEIRPPQGDIGSVFRKIIGVIQPIPLEPNRGAIYTRTDIISDMSARRVPLTVFRFRLAQGADAQNIARALESAFLPHSMEAIVSADEIWEQLSARRAFNQLFQGYMGLGLLVGVAALGVVSFRSVVERRQAIGVLRAIGFRSSMIRTQFLIESTFISLLGIVLGMILGSLTSWNIIKEINEQFGGLEFTIPWSTIAVIAGITYVFSLLTTYWPARQAAQIYPAEALRYE